LHRETEQASVETNLDSGNVDGGKPHRRELKVRTSSGGAGVLPCRGLGCPQIPLFFIFSLAAAGGKRENEGVSTYPPLTVPTASASLQSHLEDGTNGIIVKQRLFFLKKWRMLLENQYTGK